MISAGELRDEERARDAAGRGGGDVVLRDPNQASGNRNRESGRILNY